MTTNTQTAKNPEIVKIQISSAGTNPTTHFCSGKTRKAAMTQAADYIGQTAEQAGRMGAEVISHTNTKLVVSYTNGQKVTYQVAK